jgi:hypothetical protein
MRQATGMMIRHMWHEDIGHRKCVILNRSIEAAEGEYLLFSDGDCIPRRDFVEQHVHHAEPGCMLSGGAVRLPMELSKLISKDDILTGRATRARWLCKHGLRRDLKALKAAAGPLMATVLDAITPTKPTWNGGNASTWKSEVVAVNGFDERMEYGGQDREFGERLMNKGLRAKSLRYRAICVHLDHSRGYARPESVAKNRQIRNETCKSNSVWTPYGIVKQSAPGLSRAA